MPTSLNPDYLAGLGALLPPAAMRAATAQEARPLAHDFLPRSQEAGAMLARAWSDAETASERSLVEVQLLAAAAADLAIVDRLAGGAESIALRGGTPVESAIKLGLSDPAALLHPTIHPVPYRGADRDLLAAIYQALNSIQEDAIETTADAITAALTMNLSILREAAKLAGMDARQILADLGADEAVTFAIEAWQKLSVLIGEENVGKVQSAMGEAIEKLREKTAVSGYVRRFLDAETIYQESRALVQGYSGPDSDLARLTPQIIALEGSFAGRNKLAAILIRLLSLAKLAKPLRTLPWGPLLVASAYLLIIGYELYSAHDHVDSDAFPFFDRVAGVQTLVTRTLTSDN